MPAYLPDGTRITVTRTGPGRLHTTATGQVRDHGPDGFALLADGDGACSWYAAPEVLLRCYGVAQTVTPA